MALTMYSRSSTTPHIVHRMSMQQNTLEWEWVTWKCPITAFMLRLVQTVKEFERNTKVVESQKRSALKETGSSKFWGPRTVYSLVQFSQKSQHIISYLSNKPNSWGRSIIAKYVQFPVSSKYTFILHHFFFRKQPNPTKHGWYRVWLLFYKMVEIDRQRVPLGCAMTQFLRLHTRIL
jgi:hypothetical protein